MPDTSSILGYDYETVDRIVRFADANNLPPVCMIGLALQESNLDLYAHGDVNIGGSYGVYQIFTVAHGGPPERWTGYDGLENAMLEMRARWQQMFERHGSWDAVVADIVGFQQAWAPDAQGSIPWTHEMAHRQVSKAMAIYLLYLKRQEGTAEPPPPPPTRERELLDAVTVSRDTWQEQLDALATLQKQAEMRRNNDAALVDSFGG